MAPTQLPPAQQRLLDFMEALPRCPHRCHFSAVYPSPTFRPPTEGDSLENQLAEILARYEGKFEEHLLRHLAEDHRDLNAYLALLDQAHRVTEADQAAHWERIRRDADTIADQLTDLLPADMRDAGIRIVWEEQQ